MTSIAGVRGWDTRSKAALAVLIVVTASVACAIGYSATLDDSVPEITRGDLTVTGSLAAGDVEIDEYAGVGTLEYTGTGSAEWRLKDVYGTAYVKQADGTYHERDFEKVSSAKTLTLTEPGRYDAELWVDGRLAKTGGILMDGDVERSYKWVQTVSVTEGHSYSFDFSFRFSDLVGYADEKSTRHHTQSLEDSRFAVVDRTMRSLESALEAEFVEVRGTGHTTQEYADYILSFVQCCFAYPDQIVMGADGEYRVGTGGSGDLFLNGTDEYWSYPLETLYSGYGDCEDTSFLAAALLSAAGYTAGVAILPNHMVAVVGLDSFVPSNYAVLSGLTLSVKALTSTGQNIYFCETTFDRSAPCGYVSENVAADIRNLDSVSLVDR